MNYKESTQILEEIKKAKRILVNCHRSPDSDSVGSALALSKIVEAMGKEVLIVCPNEIPEDLRFLEGSEKIKRIDYSNYDFSAIGRNVRKTETLPRAPREWPGQIQSSSSIPAARGR